MERSRWCIFPRPFFPPGRSSGQSTEVQLDCRPSKNKCQRVGVPRGPPPAPAGQSFFRVLSCAVSVQQGTASEDGEQADSELPRGRKASVEAANDVTVLLNPC